MTDYTATRRSTARGFSLLELLLVLLILGLLSSAAAISFLGQGKQAEIKAARLQLDTLKRSVESYKFNTGDFPSMQEGLVVLLNGYVEQKALVDPWKQPFLYYYPTADPNYPFDIVSAGPDKIAGTADDLNLFNENMTQ